MLNDGCHLKKKKKTKKSKETEGGRTSILYPRSFTKLSLRKLFWNEPHASLTGKCQESSQIFYLSWADYCSVLWPLKVPTFQIPRTWSLPLRMSKQEKLCHRMNLQKVTTWANYPPSPVTLSVNGRCSWVQVSPTDKGFPILGVLRHLSTWTT